MSQKLEYAFHWSSEFKLAGTRRHYLQANGDELRFAPECSAFVVKRADGFVDELIFQYLVKRLTGTGHVIEGW